MAASSTFLISLPVAIVCHPFSVHCYCNMSLQSKSGAWAAVRQRAQRSGGASRLACWEGLAALMRCATDPSEDHLWLGSRRTFCQAHDSGNNCWGQEGELREFGTDSGSQPRRARSPSTLFGAPCRVASAAAHPPPSRGAPLHPFCCSPRGRSTCRV